MTILLLKIAFVLFVLCMDVLIITWCCKVSIPDAILLMFYVGAGCLITVGFAACMLYFVRDVLCM